MKVSRHSKTEAVLLYMGRSLAILARRFSATKEAVRQWMMKFEEFFVSRRLSRRKERPIILLDETKVKRSAENSNISQS
jgi:hypothetical protein